MEEAVGGVPVFVKIEDYKNVLELMEKLKKRLADAKQMLEKISEMKREEDAIIESWQNDIEKVEEKIEFIDRTLFEPENL